MRKSNLFFCFKRDLSHSVPSLMACPGHGAADLCCFHGAQNTSSWSHVPRLQPPLSRADSISRHRRCTQAPQQPFDLIHIYRSSQLADTGKPLFCPWLFAVAQSILIASVRIIKWVATCVRTAVISLNEPGVT